MALAAADPAAPTSRREPPAAAFMVRRGGPTRGGPPPPRLWSGAQPCALPTPGPTLPHCTLGQTCSCPKPRPSPSRGDLRYPGLSLPAVRLNLPQVQIPSVRDAPLTGLPPARHSMDFLEITNCYFRDTPCTFPLTQRFKWVHMQRMPGGAAVGPGLGGHGDHGRLWDGTVSPEHSSPRAWGITRAIHKPGRP